MGCFTGSILSCLFHYIIESDVFIIFQRRIFLFSFVFGAIFGGVLLYYFNSRIKLNDSIRRIQEEKISA